MEIETLIGDRLRYVVCLLVNKEYDDLSTYLENDTNINDFLVWLRHYCILPDYERAVTMPPDEEFYNSSGLHIYEIQRPKSTARQFHVCFDLWIDHEKSDLTLECKIDYFNINDIRFYLHDLHVM